MSAELPAKKSNASRYLFLFLLGLVIGAVATVMVMRAIDQRSDHFPHSVMQVMGKHVGLLQQTVQQNRCAATDTVPHVRTLRTMSNDLELAFPDLAEDQRFVTHASQLRATLDGALSAPPVGCPDTKATLAKVEEACEACHKDFGD